jgi:hypothetical protein
MGMSRHALASAATAMKIKPLTTRMMNHFLLFSKIVLKPNAAPEAIDGDELCGPVQVLKSANV